MAVLLDAGSSIAAQLDYGIGNRALQLTEFKNCNDIFIENGNDKDIYRGFKVRSRANVVNFFVNVETRY